MPCGSAAVPAQAGVAVPAQAAVAAPLVMRDAAAVTEQVPLTTLLSRAWIAFTIETDNAAEAAGERAGRRFRISMPMWANGLRFIEAHGITAAELQARARARCNIAGLERWGWITVGDPGPGRRDGYGTRRGVTDGSVLRPTRAGACARELWPAVVAASEERWQARFGAEVISALRAALLPSAGQMPSAPPEVHPSDGFRTLVISGPANDDASLAGLLGQALTARTVGHERGAPVSLPVAANFLRVIGGGTARVADLPAASGVSREAVAMAVGYLDRRGLARQGAGRSVTLTAAGYAALGDYRERAAAVDQAMRACLEAVLSQREALAEGLIPPEGCWRAVKPYLAQTQRLLADPIAALPWQPMVLHRGGWPDGS